MQRWLTALLDEDVPKIPPGSGPTFVDTPQWFSTQLIISLFIGGTAFVLFCFLRTRWEMVYMPRLKLKDFSPAPAHWPDIQKASGASRLFGWIIPTIRTSEFVVMQTVGLDAAVLLGFFRMAFLLFSIFAILAAAILMPIYRLRGKSTDAPDVELPGDDNSTDAWTLDWTYTNGSWTHGNSTWRHGNSTMPPLLDVVMDPTTSAILQLVFAYLFTAITLTFLHRSFHKFVALRQAFGLQLIHSVSSRTVLVTDVPAHLRGDRALAEYFEGCGWEVESVSVCREVAAVKGALDKRTEALFELEAAWVAWVGNPATATGYDPDIYRNQKRPGSPVTGTLIPGLEQHGGGPSGDADDPESLRARYSVIHSDKPRPTKRIRIGKSVDAIEYWEDKFFEADEEVRTLRKTGRFDPTHVAFVTFEDIKSTEEAAQVVHYGEHTQVVTTLAPEPRDVVWNNISMSRRERQTRGIVVTALVGVLMAFWNLPVFFLSSLLSYEEIKRVWPKVAELINNNDRLKAFVMNSLPTLALIAFNSLLPFLLEFLCFQQGFKSRSAIEYSLIRKHYLFLVVSVLFIVNVTSTYWALVRELADEPMKIPEKLAMGLQRMNLRHFMVSYVMLQGIGLMLLQLLNIGPLCMLVCNRIWAKTPRDYAEANAPPILNYGWVYPQALLVFTITLVYSVVSPTILVFGAIYFAFAYVVYKYKLLFIYFKPYESNGEAWKITFDRLIWSLLIFQLFVTGLFSLRHRQASQSFVLIGFMILLIAYTAWWGMTMSRDFTPLSKYLALNSICEVQRGESADRVAGVDDDASVPSSQSNLNHKRYAMNDDTLYVAPADRKTDYSQPPMNSFYVGVLNTGRRRYGHPALTGKLPKPWLPAKARPPAFGDSATSRRGVVLSLRRKVTKKLRRAQATDTDDDGRGTREGSGGTFGVPDEWRRPPHSDSTNETPSQLASDTGGESSQLLSGSTYAASSSSTPSNPWARDSNPVPNYGTTSRRLSFDPGSGVIALGDEHVWDDNGDDDDDDSPVEQPEDGSTENGSRDTMPASPSTYFHRPNRRRTLSSVGTVQAP